MGRTIESQESIWGGSVSEGGSGLVVQPFSQAGSSLRDAALVVEACS